MFGALLAAVTAAYAIAVPIAPAAPPLHGPLSAAAWQHAAVVHLRWDLQGHKPAPYATTVYITADAASLYVAFEAKQPGTIVATQHTNDAGLGTDDEVSVDLWPGGANGFVYQFTSNPIGTHYQSSSENSAYEPNWSSAGRIVSGGYFVTMKIPLDALRGARAGKPWLVQFSRNVESTGDVLVWAYNQNETSAATSVFAGSMSGLSAVRVRPAPRLQVYNLVSAAGRSIGGSTARTGADISVPFTPTSSFYGTFHPDYSNVELDQQTIAPTAYRRSYEEVRPFFTQGRQAYDNFNCAVCPFITTLYTPGIPTPRDGYAVEGTQGPVTYGAFDAVGKNRIDTAQAVNWQNLGHTVSVSLQRVSLNMPGFRDDAVESGIAYQDNKHIFSYANYGQDSGSNVADPARSRYVDAGGGWGSPTTTFGVAARSIGEYFNPADGFVSHPDIAGWGAYAAHVWLEPAGKPIRSVTLTSVLDRYHDHTGALDQTDQTAGLDVLTKGLLDIDLNSGSDYLRLSDGTFTPVTQNTMSLTFGSGAQNSNVNNGAQHGESATPTIVSFSTGRFGPGRLNYWSFVSTVRIARRGLLTGELDDSIQRLDAGPEYRQWLERLAYTYQASATSSLALGVRRIIGTPPLLDGVPVFQTGWNLSAAYHRIFNGSNEIYAVYGDASAFSTVPQSIVKWIHYFGAPKGT